jgi:hypothetical protein
MSVPEELICKPRHLVTNTTCYYQLNNTVLVRDVNQHDKEANTIYIHKHIFHQAISLTGFSQLDNTRYSELLRY